MKETWKYLEEVQGKRSRYQISNFGNLRKIHIVNGEEAYTRPLKTFRCVDRNNCRDEIEISIHNNKKSVRLKAHKLVAKYFVPNPHGFRFIKHLDGDLTNCRADNLVWCKNPHGTLSLMWRLKEMCKHMKKEGNKFIDKSGVSDHYFGLGIKYAIGGVLKVIEDYEKEKE